MHLCREIFPTILEQEGKLYEILTSTFGDNCKTLYEDFTREDEYGTSVMSIQFEKAGKCCIVSIKNRYNHTVNNPDATYGNNLDRITPGLSNSFRKLLKQRGITFDRSNVTQFELTNYVKASDGKLYKYNTEINGNYYCPENIIIKNGKPIKLPNAESQILLYDYIVDLKEKRIYHIEDSWEPKELLQNIENITVKKRDDGAKVLSIKHNGEKHTEIVLNKDNLVIEISSNQDMG